MSWLTLSQAAQRWLDRAEWDRRVEAGQAESYVDGRGQRRVWVDPADPVLGALQGLQGELRRLQAEVDRLQGALSAAPEPAPRASGSGGLRRLPPPPLPAPLEEPGDVAWSEDAAADRAAGEPAEEPAGEPVSEPVTAILRQVEARWGGSDRELERRAGLPHRFLTKARRGERNGERARESWERLEEFLRSFRRAA